MQAILQFLREGRELDALEEFSSGFQTDEKTAKAAIEAIVDASPPVYVSDEYLLISRTEEGYEVSSFLSKDEARDKADDLLSSRKEVVIAVTIARSMSNRFMLDFQ
ncbi:hypothetical protein XH94_23835 [Bradyrhizobium zhanjiangense]|uniref:Uncharacterized protein n=2 Tax=Bradyrhizobium zhanjiangense TaxID=1325107 RepID=A0A4V1L3H1_9BRAD|nr:hypothetical protein XH94_23835 [Bradyrhizobium zhanjiangense]